MQKGGAVVMESTEIIEETIIETSLLDEDVSTEKELQSSTIDTEIEEPKTELNENESGEIDTGTEEDSSSSIQYILMTAEMQTQIDYSPNLTSIEDKLDTIVSCFVVVMAVIVLSWIHLISRRRRNQK